MSYKQNPPHKCGGISLKYHVYD